MNSELTLLDAIEDYRSCVERAVNIFRAKYQVEDILEGWYSRLYQQTGSIKEYGIKFYAFHGIGLAVHFEDKIVDFDFAFFPEQRYGGFDIWRLRRFVEGQAMYSKYQDKTVLEKEFNELITHGIIFKPVLENSTTLYFFT